MEKFWSPQRHTIDAPIALLKNFMHYLKHPVSRITIEKDTTEHPDYPFVSLATYMQLFEKWGIEQAAFKCEMENLKDIASPSILFITAQPESNTEGEFIMFYGVKDNFIEYLDTRKGWVLEDVEEFSKKFGKVALSAKSIKTAGEKDFEEKEKEYVEKKNTNPDLKNVLLKDNFLTDEECEYIIKLSESKFMRSMLFAAEKNIVNNGRTSFSAELKFPQDEILNAIRKRASELIKLPTSHFEFFQCVSYESGQEYQSHFDTFDEGTERGKKIIQESGQRKYTMLAYLNDDFAGGGTYFPNLDLLVQPKKRRVVVFNNLDENAKVIKAAFHAGLPVTTGRKYAINMWVRNKPIG